MTVSAANDEQARYWNGDEAAHWLTHEDRCEAMLAPFTGHLLKAAGVSGTDGRLAGWVMAHRSSNRRRNLWVVSLLDVQPTDQILEIGFGPGIAIHALSELATRGLVYGVDHSEVMVRQAAKRNAAAIRAGRVDLRCGSVEHLPVFGTPLDKIMAVNSMGFWPEKLTRLTELRDKLRPGGQIAIASQPRRPGATKATSEQAAREIETMLKEAGFSHIRVETLPLDPPAVCVLGVKHGRSSRRGPVWASGPRS